MFVMGGHRMLLNTIKSHTITICAFLLLGLFSGSTLAVVHIIENSHFTMLAPDPNAPGWIITPEPANDVLGTFDDSMICDDIACTLTGSMTLATNTPFFGIVPIWHHIRVFKQGTYTIDTNCTIEDIEGGITDCGGSPLTLVVGPGQLGAHILFDWASVTDIDIAVVWNFFDTFPTTGSQIWNLASTDGNGDGIPGIPMVDGPLAEANFSANFNINMDPPFALSGVSVAINVFGGTTQECTEVGGSDVQMITETILYGDEVLDTIEWIVDGASTGFGETITPFLELGTHTIDVLATTESGATGVDSVSVNIVDTIPPVIDVAFLDSMTGTPIDSISKNRLHFVTTRYSSSDVCDSDPTSEGDLTAFSVESGDTISILGRNNSIVLETSSIELSVIANDASGNTARDKATLSISN